MMSFYLSYRPQRIEELDLDSVRDALSGVLRSGKFSHAYLFAGPKGTGKTSSARILAKVLNCEGNIKGTGGTGSTKSTESKKSNPVSLSEPCGECDSCTAIAKGSSMAVIEMDAASNRGIDDIRELKSRVGLTPTQGRYTIYVIDEVHMLTTEAFNALLKTLEEPPEHAVFVLCTTEAHMLPETVVSRCTRIHFIKASANEVMRSLKKAVAGESLKIDESVLRAIAERVDGSFRDGMKLLEQLTSHTEGKIELIHVDLATGFSEEYDPEKFIALVEAGNIKAVLAEIASKTESGVDFGVFINRLLEELRLRVLSRAIDNSKDLSRTMFFLELVMNASGKMRASVIPQLPLELAVVEYMVKQDNPSGGDESRNKIINDRAVKKVEVMKSSKVVPNIIEKSKKEVKPNKVEKLPEVKPKVTGDTSDLVDLKDVLAKWDDLLATIRKGNVSLEAFLKAGKPISVEGGLLTIEVAYSFHKEQLEQVRHKDLIEKTLASLGGFKCKIRYVLKGEVGVGADAKVVNVTGKVDDEELAEAVEEIFG